MNTHLLQGDTYKILKDLKSKSVNLIVTSPPYYSLRNYKDDRQYGNESLDKYIAQLRLVFSECHRILKPTGSLYLNISDTTKNGTMLNVPETLSKNLTEGIGYNKRNTIIWHKPNCTPQGKTNYTKDFEYVYYFTKSNKGFTWNVPYEPMTYKYKNLEYDGKETKDYKSAKAQEPSKTKKKILESYKKQKIRFGGNKTSKEVGGLYSGKVWIPNEQLMRIKRCVWRITVKPFKGAHYATFNTDLIETPILTSSNEGDTVLDPFCGTGTVGLVCQKYNRDFIGIDLDTTLAQYRLGKN